MELPRLWRTVVFIKLVVKLIKWRSSLFALLYSIALRISSLPVSIILKASSLLLGVFMSCGWSSLKEVWEAEVLEGIGLIPLMLDEANANGFGFLSSARKFRFCEGFGMFFPPLHLAPSGMMPLPPLSMSQGSIPAGQGYSSSE